MESAWSLFERKDAMEEGIWRCEIIKDDTILMSEPFTVSLDAELDSPYIHREGPINLLFGIHENGDFTKLDEIHPQETLVAFSQLKCIHRRSNPSL